VYTDHRLVSSRQLISQLLVSLPLPRASSPSRLSVAVIHCRLDRERVFVPYLPTAPSSPHRVTTVSPPFKPVPTDCAYSWPVSTSSSRVVAAGMQANALALVATSSSSAVRRDGSGWWQLGESIVRREAKRHARTGRGGCSERPQHGETGEGIVVAVVARGWGPERVFASPTGSVVVMGGGRDGHGEATEPVAFAEQYDRSGVSEG
jgi:hypothetical protein